MKQEFKPMSWLVKNFNISNADKIGDYDVLKYREDLVKKLKKKCTTKEEFAENMRREMQWQYWSRAEYELIIEVTEDNRIWLTPWIGCVDPDVAKIDVTNDTSFDWSGFANKHIKEQVYKNKAKIDIYDQVMYRFDEFVDYCWNYRHKWQRKNLGGGRSNEL